MSKHLLHLDVTELISQLENNKTTSEKIVRTYLQHIKEVNPALNAVVELREEEAISEARAFDQGVNHDRDKHPLAGIPISMKESFHVKGMKTTSGLLHRKNIRATEDAIIVKKLKDAGAIILCKTNTPTLCFAQETDNKVYGRTNNAWHPEATAGGSSGGEGALIGVGGAAAGFGSDIGGSIRFPAHFNGVVGFKSGRRKLPDNGHFPPTHPLQERMLGLGPITKSVQDAELIYKVLTNQKDKALVNDSIKLNFYISNELPLSHETKTLFQLLTVFLQDAFSINEEKPPLFDQSAKLWQELMSVNGAKHIKDFGLVSDRPTLISSYLREKLTHKTANHSYLTWALIGANLFKPSETRLRDINKALVRGDETISDFLNDQLLIMPVYHTAARQHGNVFQDIFSINKSYVKYMPYVAYANVWGLPAITLPIGTDMNGLPIGMQIIGRSGSEADIFKVAHWIEENFYQYKRSTVYDEASMTYA